ncbi:MAG: hypothetical protein WBC05_21435 [Sedimentisphaerales bacterium]
MNETRVIPPEADNQPDEKSLLRWQRRNSYYYRWLNGIYRHIVRTNSRVLHIGCDCGDRPDRIFAGEPAEPPFEICVRQERPGC